MYSIVSDYSVDGLLTSMLQVKMILEVFCFVEKCNLPNEKRNINMFDYINNKSYGIASQKQK